jgi:hypothetical protein
VNQRQAKRAACARVSALISGQMLILSESEEGETEEDVERVRTALRDLSLEMYVRGGRQS